MNKPQTFKEWSSRTIEENDIATADTAVKTSNTAISSDVDNIINSLETLANELSEDLNVLSSQLENAISEEYDMVNEAEGFLSTILDGIKSMKSYATLKTAYPKLKKMVLDAEVDKINQLGAFEEKSEDVLNASIEKTKEKFKEALAKVADSDMPTAKKKAAKERIRQMRDEALKDGKSETASKKLDTAKKSLTLKLDAAIRDAKQSITDALNDNEIKSDMMKKRWESDRLDIDDKFDQLSLAQQSEAEEQFLQDNPEAQERLLKSQKKIEAQQKKESAEKRAELAADLKELEDEQDRLSQEGDEKQKEANAKIKEFYKTGREYLSALASIPENGEIEADAKKSFIDSRKSYNAAKNAISKGTFKSADPSLDDDAADEMYLTFTEMVQKQVDEYRTISSTIKDGDAGTPTDNNTPTETETKVKGNKEDMIKRYQSLLKKAQDAGDDAKVADIQSKIDKISQRESWQIEGTELGRMFEMELVKYENSFILNESKYLNLSVKERFSRLL